MKKIKKEDMITLEQFYEEFKDTLDFDPMFVEEYGDYYNEE